MLSQKEAFSADVKLMRYEGGVINYSESDAYLTAEIRYKIEDYKSPIMNLPMNFIKNHFHSFEVIITPTMIQVVMDVVNEEC